MRDTEVKNVSSLGLFDNGAASSNNKRGLYQKNSTVTLWRRKKEALAVNPKAKLESFGFTVVGSKEPKKPQEETIVLSKSQKEIAQTHARISDIEKMTTPIMNKSSDNSYAYTYNNARYWSVKQ